MLRTLAPVWLAASLSIAGCSGAAPSDLFTPAANDAGPGLGPIALGKVATVNDAGADATVNVTPPPAQKPAATCEIAKLPVDEANACDACDLASCCKQLQACDADGACGALVQCIVDCQGNATCQQTCVRNHADGVQKATDVDLCQKKSCVAQCG